MKHALLAKLRKECPQVDELAFQRLVGNSAVFFDRNHNPKLSEREIFAGLYVASLMATKVNRKLRLSEREKRIWQKHFE
jgi:hypothetical protein